MIADYNKSTQKYKWTFTKEQLLKNRDDSDMYSRLRLLLSIEMTSLATRLNYRQRVIATAQVYLSRMLTKTQIGEINPYLLIATCVYVAGRAEEQPVHIRTVCTEARHKWPNYMPLEPCYLAECEFYLLSELETCLVVHHPYTPLLKLGRKFRLEQNELQACWALVNDTFSTDIPLIYSPAEIAFCVIYMVLVLKPGLVADRSAELVKKRLESLSVYMASCQNLNLKSIIGCIQEILTLYALKATFITEKVTNELRSLM